MRLLVLTALTMMAFAGNSVLNRLAVDSGAIAPIDFALIRLLSGAVTLGVLLYVLGELRWTGWAGKAVPVGGLLAYLIGFSIAYLRLDAGSGALILFGVVQVTMFTGALLAREALPLRRWLGAGLAFGGLLVMMWPNSGSQVAPGAAIWMVFAGVGWGVYSLAGMREPNPTLATGWNFVLAVVPGCLLMVGLLELSSARLEGIGLAILSGALMSGLGYALWYYILPMLGAGRAAIAQLTVPVLAAVAGLVLLAEPIGWRMAIAACFVFAGVGLASSGQSGFQRSSN